MKKWYISKTLWANAIHVIATLVRAKYGYIMDPELEVALLAGINALLRVVTKEEIIW